MRTIFTIIGFFLIGFGLASVGFGVDTLVFWAIISPLAILNAFLS